MKSSKLAYAIAFCLALVLGAMYFTMHLREEEHRHGIKTVHSHQDAENLQMDFVSHEPARLGEWSGTVAESPFAINTIAAPSSSDTAKVQSETDLPANDSVSLDSILERAILAEDRFTFTTLALKFVQLLENSPGTIDRSLDKLSSGLLSDKEREQLHALLLMSSDRVDIEGDIVDRIVSGTNTDLFLLAEDIGIRSDNERDRVLDSLPNLGEGENIGAAIRSLVPQVIPQDEREAVIQDLNPYLTDTDTRVRAAAIKTVSIWGNKEQIPVLEKGLSDPSSEVRHAAAGAALRSNIRSESIKTKLVSIMNDPDEERQVREQAFYALHDYSLDDSDYESFYVFNHDLEQLFEADN